MCFCNTVPPPGSRSRVRPTDDRRDFGRIAGRLFSHSFLARHGFECCERDASALPFHQAHLKSAASGALPHSVRKLCGRSKLLPTARRRLLSFMPSGRSGSGTAVDSRVREVRAKGGIMCHPMGLPVTTEPVIKRLVGLPPEFARLWPVGPGGNLGQLARTGRPNLVASVADRCLESRSETNIAPTGGSHSGGWLQPFLPSGHRVGLEQRVPLLDLNTVSPQVTRYSGASVDAQYGTRAVDEIRHRYR